MSEPNIRRVVTEKPWFNWTFTDPDMANPAENQTGFHIQIGTDDDWSIVEKWNNNVTPSTSRIVQYGSSNELDDGQTYYVRIRVRDMDNAWSLWSDSFNFSTNDPPNSPTITSPEKDVLWEGGSIKAINWTISTNSDYGPDDVITINLSYSINGGLNYTLNLTGLTNNGSFNWTLPNDVESSSCKILLTAYDGYENTTAISARFKIDSLAPVINDMYVTSNKTWYYEQPGMNSSGGTVWFNSLPNEGADQMILVHVVWSDVSPTSLNGTLAFGDTPLDNDTSPDTVNYTIEAFSGNELGVVLRAVDFFGRFTEAVVDFRVDNDDPTAPTNVVCRPDSFTETGEVDDDNQIFITYVDGSDGAGSGLAYALLGTDDPPTVTQNTSTGQGLVTSFISNQNVTFYVVEVDNVGNMGPSTNDSIIIDQLEPDTPVITSSTHPVNTKYYSNDSPSFSWTWPEDLSNVTQFSVKLNTVSSYIPDPLVDTVLTTNFTNYFNVDDGVNFFHVRTYDKAGHWSLGSSSFKLFIDTTAPYIFDFSETTGMTGESYTFKAQAIDNGSGIAEDGKVFWRYEGEAAFNELNMSMVDDRFTALIDIDINFTGLIEYYYEIGDMAISDNLGRLPAAGHRNFLVIDNKSPGVIWNTGDTTATTGDPVNVSVLASDNIKADRALLFVEGWDGYYTMTEDSQEANNFSTSIVAPLNSVEMLYYYIEIYDAQSNRIRVPGIGFYRIFVLDNDAPDIIFISGNMSKKDEDSVTITLLPEDNVEAPLVLSAQFYSKRTDALLSMVPVEAISGFQYKLELSPEIKSDVDYYVLVQDTSGNVKRSPASENEFYHIYIPNIYKPNGGEIWNGTREITWNVPDVDGLSYRVNLSYSIDGGTSWNPIVDDLRNEDRYTWDTTVLPDGTEYRIWLEILYSNDVYTTDISDNDFILYNPDRPVLAIDNPRNGQTIKGDTEVQWTTTDLDQSDVLDVDIYYMQLSGQNNASLDNEWHVLVENRVGSGTFTWQTTKFSDGEYNLRFVVRDGVFTETVELGRVTIYNPDAPLVTLLSPETNDVVDSKFRILWVASDADNEEIKISLYIKRVTDNNRSLIVSDLPNSGEYQFDFSDVPEGIYRIVIEADDGSVTGPQTAESGVFDIVHEEGFDVLTAVIVIALIAFMAVVLLMLFVMARQRKKDAEEAAKEEGVGKGKGKKKGKAKGKRKPARGPGMPGAPGQFPGMQYGMQPGMGGMPGQMMPPPMLPPGAGQAQMQYQGAPGMGPEAGMMAEQDQQTPVDDGTGTGVTEEGFVYDAQVAEGFEDGTITDDKSGTDIESGTEGGGEPAGEDTGPEDGTGSEPAGEEEDGLLFKAPTGTAATAGAAKHKPKLKKKFCGECGEVLGEADVVCVACGKFIK
jgi:hypothetical protein